MRGYPQVTRVAGWRATRTRRQECYNITFLAVAGQEGNRLGCSARDRKTDRYIGVELVGTGEVPLAELLPAPEDIKRKNGKSMLRGGKNHA